MRPLGEPPPVRSSGNPLRPLGGPYETPSLLSFPSSTFPVWSSGISPNL